jgi:hypothetical protein
MAVIPLAADVLGEQSLDDLGVELASRTRAAAEQDVARELA